MRQRALTGSVSEPGGAPQDDQDVALPSAGDAARRDEVDAWLARAAADRDEGAFEQLVRRHTDALYAGALRMTGSPDTAQDVVQDAWLAAWLGLPAFRGHSAVRTWLVRIVTTRGLNAVRRRHRTVPLEAVAEPVTAGTEREAELRERAAAVRAAVAALPPRQREAVVLRDLEGLSYEEVAQALGCSVASVKSALFRGRQALAVALEQHRPAAPDHPGPAATGAACESSTTRTAAPRREGRHP